MKPVEAALVGCGGIAQKGYLPALGMAAGLKCVRLVDVQLDLARSLARRWAVPEATDDYAAALEGVEAVLLAVPNHLHAPMALEALGRGAAVFCEKPLARTRAEAETMVEAARRAKAVLAAGMLFRQFPGLKQARAAFPWSGLGRIREVRGDYGHALDWPLASPYLFDRGKVGGGVVVDAGVHLLDALLWTLHVEDAVVEEYADDGESGVEAEAEARLTLRLSGGLGAVPCRLGFSRLRRLSNRIEVVGEASSRSLPLEPGAEGGTRCFARQLEAFALRVRGQEADTADGESQLRVLGLVEALYARRVHLERSWQRYEPWPESP